MPEEVVVHESVAVGQELDYDDVVQLHGRYVFTQLTCNEGFTQVVPAAGQTLTFIVPGTQVVNLSKSYLEMVLTVDSQANATYPWMQAGAISFLRQLTFQPLSGKQLIIDQYHHYSKMSLPYLLPFDDFMTLDNANLFFPSRAAQTANKQPSNGFNAAMANTEPQYAICLSNGVASNGANGPWSYSMKIPFSLFAGTILAQNRDHCFGENIQIIMTLEDPTKWLWSSTSANDPSAGALNFTVSTNLKLQNIYVQLAVESDQVIAQRIKSMHATGYTTYIPSVNKVYQQSMAASQSQNVIVNNLNSSYGERMLRIFHSVFNGTEAKNTSLDNVNAGASPVVDSTANRVIQLQTLLDNIPRQQKYISASPQAQFFAGAYNLGTIGGNQDFMVNRPFTATSVIQCSGQLGLDWTFVDDFSSPDPRIKKYVDSGHIRDGIPLFDGDHTWQFQSTTSNTAFNHYTFVQTQRKMIIGPSGITIL